MSSFLEDFNSKIRWRLERLRKRDLHRTLSGPGGVDFSSNDYLGLSVHPLFVARLLKRLRQHDREAVGAPASRLLRGNTSTHLRLEERLARFKGTEDALLFPSGYQANLGLLTTLMGPRDRVLSDRQNHASIVDAIRLSGAKKVVFPHLDLKTIEEAAAASHPGGHTFLVTESLFSMDGDIAPLGRYAELADHYHIGLVVDDAHATGCYGKERGSGLLEHFGVEARVVAAVTTFGKALGLAGACVCASRLVTECLVNAARPFIFTTAPPPLLLHALGVALDLLEEEPERRQGVLELAERLRQRLRKHGFDCLASEGPIVPVVLGNNQHALHVAREVNRKGFDVRAIRPPSVAEGSACLRLCVHASHTREEIEGLVTALVEARNSTVNS